MIELSGYEFRRDKDGDWIGSIQSGHEILFRPAAEALSAALDEIERLQAIVDRLPKDELGDPIVPNDTVFWIGEDGFSHKWTPYIATDGRTWYRTRAAAEKARQA